MVIPRSWSFCTAINELPSGVLELFNAKSLVANHDAFYLSTTKMLRVVRFRVMALNL